MRPYLTNLRERAATAVEQQEGSLRKIASLFRLSLSFVIRLLPLRRETGTFESEQRVFVDESGVTTALYPTHACAAYGPWTRAPARGRR